MTAGTRTAERPAWREWHAFAADRGARLGALVTAVLLLAAVVLPLVLPEEVASSAARLVPSDTDLRRCVPGGATCTPTLAVAAVALGHSLGLALAAAGLAALGGIPYGLASAAAGPRIGRWIIGLAEIPRAVPPVLLAIVVLVQGAPARLGLPLVLAAILAPHWAVLVRTCAGRELARDYAVVARGLGLSRWRVLAFHVLPNVLPSLVVAGCADVAYVLAVEPVLAFAGPGLLPDRVALGTLLADVARAPAVSATVLWPGVLLAAATLGFTLMALGLRRAVSRRGRL